MLIAAVAVAVVLAVTAVVVFVVVLPARKPFGPAVAGRFEDVDGRFAMVPPPGWNTDTTGSDRSAVRFTNTVPDMTPQGPIYSSLTVYVAPDNGRDLKAFTQQAIDTAAPQSLATRPVDEPIRLGDGTPARTFGFPTRPSPTAPTLHDLVTAVVHDQRAYLIEGVGWADTWDVQGALMDRAIHTLTFAGATPAKVAPTPPVADQQRRLTLVPPRGWKAEPTVSGEVVLAFTNPTPGMAIANGTYQPAIIQVSTEPATGDPATAVAAARSEFLADNEIFSGTTATIDEPVLLADGTPARLLGATANQTGTQAVIRALGLIVIRNGTVVKVEGLALQDTWNVDGPTIDAALRSLAFTG